MKLETLKREAKQLERSARLLSKDGNGPLAGFHYDPAVRGVEFALLRNGVQLLVRPDGRGGGSLVVSDTHFVEGEELRATPLVSLPPIEALFLRGSAEVGEWLARNRWERDWGYNDNFPDREVVSEYEEWWRAQHPFYTGQGFAILGGWHFAWPDGDWHDLLGDELVFWSLTGEPWIEVWSTNGQYRVVERVT